VQHPTYKAFAELGKAIKTIFHCQYSAFERVAPGDPRRPERGRAMEQRHGFRVLCPARMLSPHLIQNCMVYVNTLMIQKLLAQPHWQGRFTPRDYAALTPLIWEHVNPYGRFDLDMNTRLALQ
jgi:hypothetical protein